MLYAILFSLIFDLILGLKGGGVGWEAGGILLPPLMMSCLKQVVMSVLKVQLGHPLL